MNRRTFFSAVAMLFGLAGVPLAGQSWRVVPSTIDPPKPAPRDEWWLLLRDTNPTAPNMITVRHPVGRRFTEFYRDRSGKLFRRRGVFRVPGVLVCEYERCPTEEWLRARRR